MKRLETGEAVIKSRHSGQAVAIAMVEDDSPTRRRSFPGAHLWLLYVAPEARGQGIGRQFVRDILAKHAKTYFATVYAFGPRRGSFCARCGLRIETRDRQTGLREMVQRKRPRPSAFARTRER